DPRSVAVGDFNGDGIGDLAVANFLGDTVSLLLGKGDGTFQAAQDYVAGSFASSVAVGDFNGDNFLDLAATAGDGVTVLLNAADWGGGPAPSPPRRPVLHRPVPSQPQLEPPVALLAASKPQTVRELAFRLTDPPSSPV